MTNRKIKGNNIYSNLRARTYYDCVERNVCGVWLALLEMGVSKKRIHEIDDDFYGDTVKRFRQDAEDEVLDEFVERFLKEVRLTENDIGMVLNKHCGALSRAFPTNESYSLAMRALRNDFIMLLYQIHVMEGYGHKRLLRVIEYIRDYSQDEKVAVWEQLKIRYPDPQELPDIEELNRLRKRKKMDYQAIKEATAEIIEYRKK